MESVSARLPVMQLLHVHRAHVFPVTSQNLNIRSYTSLIFGTGNGPPMATNVVLFVVLFGVVMRFSKY